MENKNEPIVSKIRLKENDRNGEFRPFLVNHKSHQVLIPIINGFENSKEINLGYSTVTKDKGIIKPTLKKKTIYLTGGSLRDHLKNKTFSTYDCVTDASPDEIRIILKSDFAKLTEVQPEDKDIETLKYYKNLPTKENKKKVFYANKWDSKNEEMEFVAEIDGQKVHIATLSLNVKNRMLVPKERKLVTTIEKDSTSRDLTINAIYLKLKNMDGENNELFDPQGGAYDLKNGNIVTVKKTENAFASDPYLPYRIANLATRFSYNKKIPEQICKHIKSDHTQTGIKRQNLRKLYMSSIENFDIPTDLYILNLISCDLTEHIFPGLKVVKPSMHTSNSKISTTAYILRENSVEKIEKVLETMGWSKNDIENITKLVNLYNFSENTFNSNLIYDLFSKPYTMSNSIIKDFLKYIGKEGLYQKLFEHDYSSVMKKYIDSDGERKVNPKYIQEIGRMPRTEELENIRKRLFSVLVKDMMSS